MNVLLQNQHRLTDHIRIRLQANAFPPETDRGDDSSAAAILFLMGMHPIGGQGRREPVLILNQRSERVRQPGDLCFPGGGLSPRLDRLLSGLLGLPGFPLHGWNPKNGHKIHGAMARFLATGLREGFEEMRVNPFRIRFLGPMAPEHFTRFNRTVYPMVTWLTGPHAFVPNWEVARIVYIPLRQFFDPGAYTKLPLSQLSRQKESDRLPATTEFPCLIYENGNGREILWGLTFRIVLHFLETVFDFEPPATIHRPMT